MGTPVQTVNWSHLLLVLDDMVEMGINALHPKAWTVSGEGRTVARTSR
jgi:hypothetical protein